jgi:hypothetical protein
MRRYSQHDGSPGPRHVRVSAPRRPCINMRPPVGPWAHRGERPENVQAGLQRAGTGDGWTPRELRTSFVSLMSHQGLASRRSPGWSGTLPPGQPRSSTAANCGPSSPPAPKSWNSSSLEPRPSRGPGAAPHEPTPGITSRLHGQRPSSRSRRPSRTATTRQPPSSLPIECVSQDARQCGSGDTELPDLCDRVTEARRWPQRAGCRSYQACGSRWP